MAAKRAIRDFDANADPWPVADTWARRVGYRTAGSIPGRRLYEMDGGSFGPSRMVLVAATGIRVHLEAWVAVSERARRFGFGSILPPEVTVEPGGFMAYLPRRKARAEVNDLLAALGTEPITSAKVEDQAATRRVIERVDVATALSERGDFAGSRALWEEVVAEAEQQLGRDHPIPITARLDMATVLLEIGQSDRGLAELDAVLPDLERVLGPDASATLNARESRAVALAILGREDEARALARVTVDDFERVFGHDDPRTVRARTKFERRDWRTGRMPEG